MLVLTRKVQEQIRIGDDITITILRVKGNSVRVGIDAPREVRVVRGELEAERDAEEEETQIADHESAAPLAFHFLRQAADGQPDRDGRQSVHVQPRRTRRSRLNSLQFPPAAHAALAADELR